MYNSAKLRLKGILFDSIEYLVLLCLNIFSAFNMMIITLYDIISAPLTICGYPNFP